MPLVVHTHEINIGDRHSVRVGQTLLEARVLLALTAVDVGVFFPMVQQVQRLLSKGGWTVEATTQNAVSVQNSTGITRTPARAQAHVIGRLLQLLSIYLMGKAHREEASEAGGLVMRAAVEGRRKELDNLVVVKQH